MSSTFEFDPKLMAGSGLITRGTAGEALGNRQLVYEGAAGLWYLADSDAAATMPTIGITRHSITSGNRGQILLHGYIGDSSWVWTTGGEMYASTVAGGLTQTAPTPPDFVQVVGIATTGLPVGGTTRMIYFNPFPPTEGLGASVTKEEYYPPVESDAYLGQHFGAQMLDGVETIVGFEFLIPNGFHTLVSAVVMVVQDTTAAPNMVWNATTDFAEACSTEDYDANEDAVGVQTDALLQKDIVCLDISTALTGVAASDLVGMEFLRDGDAAGDTVGGPVYCLGLRLRYR